MTHKHYSQLILSKIAVLSVFLSLPLWGNEPITEPYRKEVHIYLCLGQSNMAGRAPIPDSAKGDIANVFLLNQNDKWETAKNPLNRYSTIRKGLGMQRLGPSYSFAKAMAESKDEVSIGLVVNAKGGSSIESWAKGSKFYKEAVRRAKEAIKAGSLMGVIWHQGESNAKNSDGYLEKLSELIANLREDLNSPKLPFVAGQVNNLPPINEAIAKLPSIVSQSSYVSSEGLKAYDRWHFDTESSIKLGNRYAAEMKKLISKN